MSSLALCASCSRHFRPHEPRCPFCGASAASATRPAPPALWSGASRSRRYAASAAFLASSATFACGGATNAQGDGGAHSGGEAPSNAGATTGGTNANAGNGGTSDRGGNGGANANAGNGGTNDRGGNGGANAGAGTGGVAGSPITGNRACSGHTERAGCRTSADCPSDGATSVYCAMEPRPRGCGNPSFLQKCPVAGCAEGTTCRTIDECGNEYCAGNSTCDSQGCKGQFHCVDNACVAKPCDDGGPTCEPGYACDPGATTPNHCVPIACDGGYECAPWHACNSPGTLGSDAHGCGPKTCTQDTDCGGCGYCVNARCEPTLGQCYQLMAMPYGCVWPDEELV